ncbi:MAG: hypothetical protein AABY75_05410 [Bacteroidota bacterium]
MPLPRQDLDPDPLATFAAEEERRKVKPAIDPDPLATFAAEEERRRQQPPVPALRAAAPDVMLRLQREREAAAEQTQQQEQQRAALPVSSPSAPPSGASMAASPQATDDDIYVQKDPAEPVGYRAARVTERSDPVLSGLGAMSAVFGAPFAPPLTALHGAIKPSPPGEGYLAKTGRVLGEAAESVVDPSKRVFGSDIIEAGQERAGVDELTRKMPSTAKSVGGTAIDLAAIGATGNLLGRLGGVTRLGIAKEKLAGYQKLGDLRSLHQQAVAAGNTARAKALAARIAEHTKPETLMQTGGRVASNALLGTRLQSQQEAYKVLDEAAARGQTLSPLAPTWTGQAEQGERAVMSLPGVDRIPLPQRAQSALNKASAAVIAPIEAAAMGAQKLAAAVPPTRWFMSNKGYLRDTEPELRGLRYSEADLQDLSLRLGMAHQEGTEAGLMMGHDWPEARKQITELRAKYREMHKAGASPSSLQAVHDQERDLLQKWGPDARKQIALYEATELAARPYEEMRAMMPMQQQANRVIRDTKTLLGKDAAGNSLLDDSWHPINLQHEKEVLLDSLNTPGLSHQRLTTINARIQSIDDQLLRLNTQTDNVWSPIIRSKAERMREIETTARASDPGVQQATQALNTAQQNLAAAQQAGNAQAANTAIVDVVAAQGALRNASSAWLAADGGHWQSVLDAASQLDQLEAARQPYLQALRAGQRTPVAGVSPHLRRQGELSRKLYDRVFDLERQRGLDTARYGGLDLFYVPQKMSDEAYKFLGRAPEDAGRAVGSKLTPQHTSMLRRKFVGFSPAEIEAMVQRGGEVKAYGGRSLRDPSDPSGWYKGDLLERDPYQLGMRRSTQTARAVQGIETMRGIKRWVEDVGRTYNYPLDTEVLDAVPRGYRYRIPKKTAEVLKGVRLPRPLAEDFGGKIIPSLLDPQVPESLGNTFVALTGIMTRTQLAQIGVVSRNMANNITTMLMTASSPQIHELPGALEFVGNAQFMPERLASFKMYVPALGKTLDGYEMLRLMTQKGVYNQNIGMLLDIGRVGQEQQGVLEPAFDWATEKLGPGQGTVTRAAQRGLQLGRGTIGRTFLEPSQARGHAQTAIRGLGQKFNAPEGLTKAAGSAVDITRQLPLVGDKSPGVRAVHAANSLGENGFRIAAFFDQLKRGQNLDTAANNTVAAFVDYQNKTRAQKEIFRVFWPYQMWQLGNIKNQVGKRAIREPGATMLLTHMLKQFDEQYNDMTRDEQAMHNTRMPDKLMVGTGRKHIETKKGIEEGGQLVDLSSVMGEAALVPYLAGAREAKDAWTAQEGAPLGQRAWRSAVAGARPIGMALGENVATLVQTPIEIPANFDFHTRKPLSRMDESLGQLPAATRYAQGGGDLAEEVRYLGSPNEEFFTGLPWTPASKRVVSKFLPGVDLMHRWNPGEWRGTQMQPGVFGYTADERDRDEETRSGMLFGIPPYRPQEWGKRELDLFKLGEMMNLKRGAKGALKSEWLKGHDVKDKMKLLNDLAKRRMQQFKP